MQLNPCPLGIEISEGLHRIHLFPFPQESAYVPDGSVAPLSSTATKPNLHLHRLPLVELPCTRFWHSKYRISCPYFLALVIRGLFFTVRGSSSTPNPEAGRPPLLAVGDCLVSIFAAGGRPSTAPRTHGRAFAMCSERIRQQIVDSGVQPQWPWSRPCRESSGQLPATATSSLGNSSRYQLGPVDSRNMCRLSREQRPTDP
jgi:hypothetical protein